jgi:flagellar motor switch protein FliN/FliY
LASIDEVVCDISVVLGSTTMPIHQMLRMSRGAIIELEATEDDEVTILANNLPVAKGTVSVNGNRIGVAITRLLSRPETESRR